MANRNTLHKNKLNAFKKFLDDHNIAYRDGKGTYQEMQIQTPNHGWKCVYRRNNMPEHFTIDDLLWPIVMDFIKTKDTETVGVWSNTEWEIKWQDEDHVLVLGPYNQRCVLTGGDFESLLSGLCNAYDMGKAESSIRQ